MKRTIYQSFKIIVAIFFLFLPAEVRTQPSMDAKIRQTNEHYELGDWIGYSSSRYINSIAIGKEYVYFATTGGITRYHFYEDRWEFPWTTCNGLAHNQIICVAYDENTNTLWCSTPVGVSYYEAFSRLWHNLYADELNFSPQDWILSIGFTNSDVWLETRDGNLYQSSTQFGNYYFEEKNNTDQEKIEWFGTRGKSTTELPILFMRDGYLFDSRGTITDLNLRHFQVTYHVFDRWGYLWIATWGLGAAKADTRTQQLELLPFGLYQANATALVFDEEQFWIGGWDEQYYEGTNWGQENGITLWERDRNRWSFFQAKYTTDFNNDLTYSIKIDGSSLWIGTDQGLCEYHQTRNRWYTFDQTYRLRSDKIYDVAFNQEYIFVANTSGIDRLTKKSIHSDSVEVVFVAYRHLREREVYNIEIQGDSLWAGTQAGAYLYNVRNDSGFFFEGDWSPRTRPVTAVSCSPSWVWFGTDDEVDVYDLKQKKWLPSPARLTSHNARVNYIAATDEVVFVATTEGVWKFDPKRNYWKQFTRLDGLISDLVNWIHIDGDYVWFATNDGMCRFYWNSPMRID